MTRRQQTARLTAQHELNQGVVGIFGKGARLHDLNVGGVSTLLVPVLQKKFPGLTFRKRRDLTKREINEKLHKIDDELGQELYVKEARIIPDGGIIEVKDDQGDWRVILVTEAKFQGKEVQNISSGILVGTKKDQDIMAAGNAIERSHKNIREFANFMMGEPYFPYVLFLEGSNFLTENVTVTRPDGRDVTLVYNSSNLNRIDRLTAANYSMPINTNLCENRVVTARGQAIMLQAASIYTEGRGGEWDGGEMLDVMYEVATTSIKMLATDLFDQLTPDKGQEQS
jgi:type II restriction enzyme